MMMTNLFSIFDPSKGVFSFGWFSLFLFLFFFSSFYFVGGGSMFFVSYFFSFVKNEIDYVVKGYMMKSIYIFFFSVILMLFFFNFLAMFPYIFSLTSHLLITLPVSYSFWVGVILFSWTYSLSHFFSHLVPMGTPVMLISFMVMVELLSNFIRPLALTFRLTANMMAGHLLLSLIGSAVVYLSFFPMVFGSFFQSLLVIMELGVSFIQAYVFFTLLLLYLSEGLN